MCVYVFLYCIQCVSVPLVLNCEKTGLLGNTAVMAGDQEGGKMGQKLVCRCVLCIFCVFVSNVCVCVCVGMHAYVQLPTQRVKGS